jgi:lysophospholipase L1-like esterase
MIHSAHARWLPPVAVVGALCCLFCLSPSVLPAADQPPAIRWAEDLARFESADREHPPAQGGILFLGSSTIRRWDTLTDDFPGLPVLNRGFGGSQMSDAAALVPQLVLPYAPRQIVLYEGDNDLNKGKTPEQVLADFQTFLTQVRERMPQCRISILAIKPSPKRWHLKDAITRTNRQLAEAAAADPRIDFIDVFTPMLDTGGEPRPELFVEDGVHLTPEGYAIWTRTIRPHLR